MSENSLVLKCAAAGRFVIQATDFPVARVFDTVSSSLIATLELPRRQRSSLSAVTLTAVGIGLLNARLRNHNSSNSKLKKGAVSCSNNNNIGENYSEEVEESMLETCYAAAGLSNGTLLLHDVTRNKLMSHMCVSTMQRPIQDISFCGAFVFVLCQDGKVYVINMHALECGICTTIHVGKDVHAISATEVISNNVASNASKTLANSEIISVRSTIITSAAENATVVDNGKGEKLEHEEEEEVVESAKDAAISSTYDYIRLVTTGTSITVYECDHLTRNNNYNNNVSSMHIANGVTSMLQFHKVTNFAAHGAPADYAWVSAFPAHSHLPTTLSLAHNNVQSTAHDKPSNITSDAVNNAKISYKQADSDYAIMPDSKKVPEHTIHGTNDFLGVHSLHHVTHSIAALTANAEEGLLRLWDVDPNQQHTHRCRRTLLCGQRIAHVEVLEHFVYRRNSYSANGNNNVNAEDEDARNIAGFSNNNNSNNNNINNKTKTTTIINETNDNSNVEVVVLGVVIATTFTGSVLVWDFTNKTGILPSVVEPLPVSPTLVLTCSQSVGRLLFATALFACNTGSSMSNILTNNSVSHVTDIRDNNNNNKKNNNCESNFSMRQVNLLFLRGRFALPQFDVYKIDELLEYDRYYHSWANRTIETLNTENRNTNQEQLRLEQQRQHKEMIITRKLAMLGFGAEVQVIDVPLTHVTIPFTSSTSQIQDESNQLSHNSYNDDDNNNNNTNAVNSKSNKRFLSNGKPINNTINNNNNNNNNENNASVTLLSSDATFQVMDNVWATYRTKLATKAMYASSQSFPLARSVHASSIKELPTGDVTLEQRLRALQLAASNAYTTQAILSRREGMSTITSNNSNSETKTNIESSDLEMQANGDDIINDDNTTQNDGIVGKYSGALGLATIPLYQALHANDAAATMELLSLSSRSMNEMRATVMSLQLPYCLQLIRVLSERLGICNSKVATSSSSLTLTSSSSPSSSFIIEQNNRNNNERDVSDNVDTDKPQIASTVNDENANINNNNSPYNNTDKGNKNVVTVGGGTAALAVHAPMLRWFNVILQCRGLELYELQKQMSSERESHHNDNNNNSNSISTNYNNSYLALIKNGMSPPKDFIAPLLQQYRAMCELHDKLSMLQGRLSIFNAVRPQERHTFFNAPHSMSNSNMESGYLTLARHKRVMQTSKARRGASVSKRVISALRDDVIFPRMFTEVRSRTNGPYVVRVRSKLASLEKKKQKEQKNASLLRQRAKEIARRKLRKEQTRAKKDIADDDDNDNDNNNGNNDNISEMLENMDDINNDEVDLDALENMSLNSEKNNSDEYDNEYDDNDEFAEEEEAEELETDKRGDRKRVKALRVAADEMIPDIGTTTAGTSVSHGDEPGSDDEMNEVEFSSESDDVDDLHSDIANTTDEESSGDEDNEDDDDEDENSDDNESEIYYEENEKEVEDGIDSSDEGEMAGIGSDMQHLLSTHNTADDEAEKRKTKRVRTD